MRATRYSALLGVLLISGCVRLGFTDSERASTVTDSDSALGDSAPSDLVALDGAPEAQAPRPDGAGDGAPPDSAPLDSTGKPDVPKPDLSKPDLSKPDLYKPDLPTKKLCSKTGLDQSCWCEGGTVYAKTNDPICAYCFNDTCYT
jgi:hypothetical protein